VRTLIIPCAGKGSRLIRNDKNPKSLSQFRSGNFLSYIVSKVGASFDEIILVIKPEFILKFQSAISETLSHEYARKIVYAFQPEARGSLDAVQLGLRASKGEIFAVVWGDQLGVSPHALEEGLRALEAKDFVIPVHHTPSPYVWLEHENNVVTKVKRSRDGDTVPDFGWADTGVFIFSRPVAIKIVSSNLKFDQTSRELDFTYLVPQLTKEFETLLFEREDPLEVIAVNTNEQLQHAEEWLP
jgi:NDP-sugar pyrophosphorylase family protein